MNWTDYIEASPSVLVGKPIVKGTRLAVELVLDLLAAGCSEQEILANYPNLGTEQIRACVAYAAQLVKDERVYPQGA